MDRLNTERLRALRGRARCRELLDDSERAELDTLRQREWQGCQDRLPPGFAEQVRRLSRRMQDAPACPGCARDDGRATALTHAERCIECFSIVVETVLYPPTPAGRARRMLSGGRSE